MIDAKKLRELAEYVTKMEAWDLDDGKFKLSDIKALLSSCERAERVERALEKALLHISAIGCPVDSSGKYDKDGTWQFRDSVPLSADAREVESAFHALRLALSEHEASGKAPAPSEGGG